MARLKRLQSGQRRSPTRRSPHLGTRRWSVPGPHGDAGVRGKLLQIGQLGAVAQAEGLLLMGARAIACAARSERCAAHLAARPTITRIVTHGRAERSRHGWSSRTRCLGASLAR
jgi:hypothetical protein